MEFITGIQIKRTLEQHIESYDIIREEKNLLKLNQEREDARYWAVKKHADDLEITILALQQDKDGLQRQVQMQQIEIIKLKQEIEIIVHQRDEVIWDKDKTQATCNKSIQKLQCDAKRINIVVNSITILWNHICPSTD